MRVKHIIDDLESVFEKQPEAKNYGVAFARYSDDGDGTIIIDYVEAFDWDEDEEFFLLPEGCAKYYDLEAINYKAQNFVNEIKKVDVNNFLEFQTYAIEKMKLAKDGSIATLNSPTWGTGILDSEKVVYFFHGKRKAS